MANLQSYFNSFHDNIKLSYDDNKVLRDKRDELLDFLKENMPEGITTPEIFHQGSYAMYTGIKPFEDGDYDIDVGLFFDISKDDYENPVTAKKWVYDALKDAYPNIEMKKPCVAVKFESEEENNNHYHVDFTIYAAKSSETKIFLAKGKLSSNSENRCWEESDPKELVNKIKTHLTEGKEREQFRRVIRYLKRWKDIKFKGIVNRPTGIGLTVAGLTHFNAKYDNDYFTNTKTYKDLDALEAFVQNMINAFTYVSNADGEWEERMGVYLPTTPYNDIYEKMSGTQMKSFKEKLQTLLENLQKARDEVDPVEGCKILAIEFGDDFPIPEESVTAQKRGPAMLVDHSSA
ncbi:TPA: nucleotidyltransferase [Bacillus cereus]|uniref:nucleotidyltransferase domain-containing protein n=1 Tax=unclassified Bacillus cereus group TaxID=2750818 RepID=UPI0029CBB84D|nr:nucleotidyltransferase [Bacillus cereus]HEI9572966.1 nucleotidyltransferase [Bacillus cereus]HEI9578603.1 nucleotidyltransferase [Bacillus cereus]HEP1847605.1 nucleotidyltransferase [Bacillus cereus]